MKFKKDTDFKIASGTIDTVFTKNVPLDYVKWVEFVDSNPEHFIWKEHTDKGKEELKNVDQVPESFKERLLASLNKVVCFQEFNAQKGYYEINVSFSKRNNWISIGFERVPKLEDLKIFVKMANHLDALLLKDGKEIIDEKTIESLT